MTRRRKHHHRPEGGGHRDRGARAVPKFTPVEWDEASLLLWRRQRGKCADGCGSSVDVHAERHHRQRRAIGGDRLANLVLLTPAHHARAHASPEAARAAGIIVSSYEADPATVPLAVDGRPWLLDDEGGMRPVP